MCLYDKICMHLILGEKNTHKNFNKKLSNTFQIKTKDYKLILKRLYHRLTQILTFNAHNIYSQSDSDKTTYSSFWHFSKHLLFCHKIQKSSLFIFKHVKYSKDGDNNSYCVGYQNAFFNMHELSFKLLNEDINSLYFLIWLYSNTYLKGTLYTTNHGL